jgi:tetratricopeptide (TPR) repeat protein
VRAETRHQLKEDRFSKATLQVAEKTVHWTQEHQGKLMAAAIAVLVIAAIAVGGWYYISSQDEKASFDFAAAVRTFNEPVRPTGVPEQPGFPSFESEQVRATAARKQFQAVADNYPSTRTGKMARYFVGLTDAELGDNAAAERNLQAAAGSSDAELAALGKFALASVYDAEKKDSQAVDVYRQLIEKPTVTVSKVTAQFELARFYASHQKPDEAKKVYEQIEKDNPASEAASLAQRRSSELK